MSRLKNVVRDGSMQASDPFQRQRLEREERLRVVGACKLCWMSVTKKVDFFAENLLDTHTHRCRLVRGHISVHKCNCGATLRRDRDRTTHPASSGV